MEVNASFLLLPLNWSWYSLLLPRALQLCPVGPDASVADQQVLHGVQELLPLRAHRQQPADSFPHAQLQVDLLLGVTILEMQKNQRIKLKIN